MRVSNNILKCALPEVLVPKEGVYDVLSDPVSPTGVFYPTGIVVDPEVASQFMVTDVRIGGNSQLISRGAVPGCLFAADTPHHLRLDKMPLGSRVGLSVRNVGPTEQRFRAWVLGSRDVPRQEEGLYVVGFGSTTITNEITVVMNQLQVAFHPRVLYVPPGVLDVFRVNSLRQGRYLDADDVPLVNPHALAGEEFLESGYLRFASESLVGRDVPILVDVTRVSDERRAFTCAILGEPLSVKNASRFNRVKEG